LEENRYEIIDKSNVGMVGGNWVLPAGMGVCCVWYIRKRWVWTFCIHIEISGEEENV